MELLFGRFGKSHIFRNGQKVNWPKVNDKIFQIILKTLKPRFLELNDDMQKVRWGGLFVRVKLLESKYCF